MIGRYYLIIDSDKNIIGSGYNADGLLPECTIECTTEQAAKPLDYKVDSAGNILESVSEIKTETQETESVNPDLLAIAEALAAQEARLAKLESSTAAEGSATK